MSLLTQEELLEIFHKKNGNIEDLGWGPRIRRKFGYFTPHDIYEGIINKLVTTETSWLDVGSGRSLFPDNKKLEKELSQRCKLLVGCDPDDTLSENQAVHEKVFLPIDQFASQQEFDLVTLRMVAEHIANPQEVLTVLSSQTCLGGKVVVFTIFRWSPVPILTALIPFNLHHPIKKLFWKTEEKDTFPVSYQMNSRKDLKALFNRNNFKEIHFSYLDDCSTLARFRVGVYAEMIVLWLLRLLGCHYPEVCLLGIYEKETKDQDS